MLSINAVDGLQRSKKLNKLQPQNAAFAGIKHQPAAQSVPVLPHRPLTSQQADALRLLTFSGKTQRAKMEKDFLHTLKTTKDPVEKATVANILGRVKSVLATPHLLKMLDEKEDVRVRTSAAQALASIGSGSHPDGFSAPDLSKALWETYQKRKEALQQEIEKPTKDLSYDDKLKRDEEHEDRFDEINALVHGVSQLDVVRHNKELVIELRKMLHASQEREATVQELSHHMDLAEAEFHKLLQEKYHKPISEILKGMPTDQLNQMKKNVQVASPDGKAMNLLEISEQLDQMKLQQEKFDLKIVGSLMDALSYQDGPEVNAAIKGGLDSDHHSIRARALDTLAERNKLNYSSDVYPNLSARHPEVRQAAIQALLNSPEQAAKQKTLELTNPAEFFKTAGGLNQETLHQYVGFLSDVAERGDEFVEALGTKVMNPDYSADSRQISLQLLGMIAREPIAHRVSPETAGHARSVLKLTAMGAPGKTAADKAAIATTATSLWVKTKDPAAIPAAILLAETNGHKTSGRDQERLLSSVVDVLTADRDEQTKAAREGKLANSVLDILQDGKSGLLDSHQAKELRSHLKPDRMQRMLDAESPEDFADACEGQERDLCMAEKLQPILVAIRPALTKLAESDKSKSTQLLAFQVMGLLQDKDSVQYLIDRVNNPLKGQIDWKADLSYRGNPSMDSLRIRFNALKALGDIGDARALKVFTPLLEDSNLRRVIAGPLAKIAPDANKHSSDAELKSLRTKLSKLMSDPDTGRGMRAVRLRAANAMYQFNGGVDALKAFITNTPNPNFKRQAQAALVSNNHALEPEHADHHLVKDLLNPELGVQRLHERGITGKGVDIAIVDGGFVDDANKEGFQDRVKLPATYSGDPESEHPTMVMSTAAGNGKLKGVAPDARVFSDRWPEFDSSEPMDVYKKIIEGKMRGENNVRTINNSWGFSNQNIILHKDVRKLLKEFKNVVDMAEKAGIQFVFAAGNEGEEAPFPELGTMTLFGLDVDKLTDDQKRNYNYILDKVITVGALNTQGSDKRADHRLAEFSSVGDSTRSNKMKPTVIAPGADMMVYGWDKVKGNPKELVNGTSFASPYTTGVLALMDQVNKNLTPKDKREILKLTAVKLQGVPISQQGYGEVNPEAAVKMAENWPAGKSGSASTAAPKNNPPQPPADKGHDGDVEMADAPTTAAAEAKTGHKRPWNLLNSGSKSGEAEQGLDLGKTRSGRIKRHKGSETEASAPRKRHDVSFAGAGAAQGAGTGSGFNRLTGLLSGHTTPSSTSKLDFNHGPASAPRMNPPKEPLLDITR